MCVGDEAIGCVSTGNAIGQFMKIILAGNRGALSTESADKSGILLGYKTIERHRSCGIRQACYMNVVFYAQR